MDLNLIRLFVTVYETRSLTVAAQRLYVTQPAVSQALARLRVELDDPVFIREHGAMQPTPLSTRIYPTFREAYSAISRTLEDLQDFVPKTSERTIHIALSELGEIGWLPPIARAISKEAPWMRLEVRALKVEDLPVWLSRGEVDLAITPANLSEDFEHTTIKTQRYVIAMSNEHPAGGTEITAQDYAAFQHLRVAEDSGNAHLDHALMLASIKCSPTIVAQHFASVPMLLESNPHLVATMPASIAHGWAKNWSIDVRDLPFAMPPITVRLYRRSSSHHTAAVGWAYDVVKRAIRGSEGSFDAIGA